MTNYTTRKLARTAKFTLTIFVLLGLLAGCNSFNLYGDNVSNSNDSGIQTTTVSTAKTQTPTPTQSPVPSPTTENSSNATKGQKYDIFLGGYISGLEEHGIIVLNSSSDTDNDRISVTYEMANPTNNSTVSMERENISFGYSAGVEYYTSEDQSQRDESWVPKRVNITAIAPNGEIYETAHITYDLAIKWVNGEISDREYLLEYYSTIETGPANPAAESN